MSAAETNSDRTAAKATAVALDSGRPRLLIVDDQDEVRRTVAELLEDTFRIIGMAEDGERAIELASVLHPDVVVLDICMPVLNGIDAAERLRASGYPTKVVFLSMQDDPEFVSAALATGALGYVLKSSVGTELISAIWKAVEGRRFISPALCWH
jgi:DNA-binding NarL/FixJ family response regulator